MFTGTAIDYYPAFLRLDGRRCVVVGGGTVAERKVRVLLESGAALTVVAPAVTDGIRAVADGGALIVEQRPYRAGDLNEAFLAVAATGDRAVNAAVVEAARQVGALVSAVDDPLAGDFIVPATVRRGEVTIAISTGGRSPTFARQLRQELDGWLTPARLELLDLLGDVRRELQLAGRNPEPPAWREAVDPHLIDAVERGDREGARRRLLRSLGDAAEPAAGL